MTDCVHIDGDPYLWDDFAFATHDGLVPELKKGAAGEGKQYSIAGGYTLIDFDFSLFPFRADVKDTDIARPGAGA